MSAEKIAGVAIIGLGLASTGIVVQAAGNLIQQTKRLNVRTHEKSRQRRGSQKQWQSLSVSNAVFGERRQRRKRRR